KSLACSRMLRIDTYCARVPTLDQNCGEIFLELLPNDIESECLRDSLHVDGWVHNRHLLQQTTRLSVDTRERIDSHLNHLFESITFFRNRFTSSRSATETKSRSIG